MSKQTGRPILRYHGGKFKLAPWIIGHFPKHRNYVEAFGGAASVLMQKPRSKSEVYNDKWDVVVNVFQVLRNPELAQQLQRVLLLTPYARTEFEMTGDILLHEIADPVEKARRTILRSFAGFGSAATNAKYATGFRANNSSNGTNCAVDWANYPSYVPNFIERLKGVVIENRDYREILAQQDGADTLFFLDPPYPHSTRNMARGNAAYAEEMSDQDHIDMAAVVKKVRGGVIIAGYDCPLYQDLFREWHISQKMTFADGARPRVECLWSNRPFNNVNKLFL